jgi:thiamine biosynthesis lipoprotein
VTVVAEARCFHQFDVMGTVFSFDLRGFDGVEAGAVEQAEAWLHEMDGVFSTYRADSAVNRLARRESRLSELPPVVAEVLELCADATARTGGWFTAQPGGRFDPSGMVKGWAIDGAARILRTAGARNLVLNGGGDVLALGAPEDGRRWRVGIADPFDRTRALGYLDVGPELTAVATSGTAARGGHVLDPFTGRPALGIASITVLGSAMAETDMLATAALAMGSQARDWLQDRPGVEAFVVSAEGEQTWTSGWPGVLLEDPAQPAASASRSSGVVSRGP